MSLFGRLTLKAAVVALAATTGAASITIASTDAAYAAGKKKDKKDKKDKKGNRGNKVKASNNGNSGSNGNSGGNGNRSNRNSGGSSNGGGAIARELGGLNAANASPAALRSASPNSMPGKIYAYQQAKLAIVGSENARNQSYTELYRLQNLSSAQIASLYPNGDYPAAVSAAEMRYNADTTIYSNAINTANQSLSSLTNGQQLSAQAMAELNALLGL